MSIEKATMKQKDLAMTIAEELGIDVPDEDSSDAYSDFICEYYGEFKRERNVDMEAEKCGRWSISIISATMFTTNRTETPKRCRRRGAGSDGCN